MLKITKNICNIEGLCLIELSEIKICDAQVYSVYDKQVFLNAGLIVNFVQDNQVYSKANVLRGMHINVKHPQGKIIRVVKGCIYDVVVDLRKNSKSYKKCFGIELSEENRKMLYIPEGFGHGYFAITDTLVEFKVTTHYIPMDEVSFSWRSCILKNIWPSEISNVIQNDNDANSLDLDFIKF